MTGIPRNEYPRPQFRRDEWLCLNGEWQFEIDRGDSGLERGLLDRELNSKIVVPFCPESKLSGIEDLDYHNAVYRRTVAIPQEWRGGVLLHFRRRLRRHGVGERRRGGAASRRLLALYV